MKIYMIGAHACGKSTLARYVSKKYNIPLITEVARMVLSEKELQIDELRHNLDIVDDYQSQIFERQISEETKYTNFVSDRSFDCLAYSAQHSRIFSDTIKSLKFKEYIEGLKDLDSFIFFIRPTKATLRDDGIRENLSWDGIIAIDAMIKILINMFNLRYFQINTDNMQERVGIIDAVLSLSK
jgi:adenylate kinase family enzyme